MNYVEITDKELWYYHFVCEMAAIFFVENWQERSKKMIDFFKKLLDQNSKELDQHFKTAYSGRYINSPEGIDLRKKIQERHDAALTKAIRFFSKDKWICMVADMIMCLHEANSLIESDKIIHRLVIPMICNDEADVTEYKQKISEKLSVRMYTFSDEEKEDVIVKSGF